MSAAGLDFRRRYDIPDDPVWRPLDRLVARWVLAHGGSPTLAAIAGQASHADGRGDSALRLDDQALAQLAGEPMVGTPAQATAAPFVVDRGHFYLRRNYLHEIAVAEQINRRRRAASPAAGELPEDVLDLLFDGDRGSAVQPQREAVRRVLGRRLFVLTGGPGTGKTTTVLRMLLALSHDHALRHGRAPLIRLAAPTGKAAQRLSQALHEGAERLRHRLTGDWRTHLEACVGSESGTLHRLLGSRGELGGFVHHAENRLPADIVVIDEASMIDLALLRATLDALADDALLILVGDADQLTSVATGSVLQDLVGALEAQAAPDLVRLTHAFRAQPALAELNRAVRDGDYAELRRILDEARTAVEWQQVAGTQDLHRVLLPWCKALHASLERAGAFAPQQTDGAAPAVVVSSLQALRQQQLLCALRETEFGAEAVNAAIEQYLRRQLAADNERWYPGRAVLITRNDYALDLYNGDIGICLYGPRHQPQVWFEANDASAGESVRAFAPSMLPMHESAFALTVHKSQGSEYARVAVLLPADPDAPILSRQLLYTALSRAKTQIGLWATSAAVERALLTPAQRCSGLPARITHHA